MIHDAIAEQRAIYDEVLGASCEIVYVAGATDTDRGAALARADAVIATHPLAEFRDGDKALLAGAQLIQQTTAGVDHVLFDRLPDGVPVAANPGTYSEPVAEHVLAMTFAAAKRLLIGRCGRASSTNSRPTACWRAVSQPFSDLAGSARKRPDC